MLAPICPGGPRGVFLLYGNKRGLHVRPMCYAAVRATRVCAHGKAPLQAHVHDRPSLFWMLTGVSCHQHQRILSLSAPITTLTMCCRHVRATDVAAMAWSRCGAHLQRRTSLLTTIWLAQSAVLFLHVNKSVSDAHAQFRPLSWRQVSMVNLLSTGYRFVRHVNVPF